MDSVIVVGTGLVGLSLSLAVAGQGVPAIVVGQGPARISPGPARTLVMHSNTTAMAQQLGCARWRVPGGVAHRAARQRPRWQPVIGTICNLFGLALSSLAT